MAKPTLTMGTFVAGLLITILVASAVSFLVSMQLAKGPQEPNTPDYDSGWVDIANKAGQYFNVTHNLNSTDIIVDIRGKATANGGAHQKYFGLTGNQQWTKTFGGTDSEIGISMVQTSDGGYAMVGWTTSYGAGFSDLWLVKTDVAGNMQWNQTYGGAGSDGGTSVVQTSDGGYALAGGTESYGAGFSDFWLVKTDVAGNMQWSQTYGGAGSDVVQTVVQTSDVGYALAGYTNSYGASSKFWLVKTDIESGLAWTDSTANTITLYRGSTDVHWNYVRVRIWRTD